MARAARIGSIIDLRNARSSRALLLVSTIAAAALVASAALAGLLSELLLSWPDRLALRGQLAWLVAPAMAPLIALAVAAGARLARLVPGRDAVSARDHAWFALACVTLVLLPSAVLLARWADAGHVSVDYRVIQLLELAAQGLVLALLLRAARRAWYVDDDRH